MYDEKIERAIKKNIMAMLLIGILVYMVERIYSIFSHGVSSIMMSTMAVTVLILGIGGYAVLLLFYLKLNLRLNFRRFSNMYNAGIATIVVGQFLSGVVSIAGTSSDYIKFYFIIGGMLIVGAGLKGVRS